jgi:hypothetical protein
MFIHCWIENIFEKDKLLLSIVGAGHGGWDMIAWGMGYESLWDGMWELGGWDMEAWGIGYRDWGMACEGLGDGIWEFGGRGMGDMLLGLQGECYKLANFHACFWALKARARFQAFEMQFE